jgi:tetratricopeptide (TPR) repeat protein
LGWRSFREERRCAISEFESALQLLHPNDPGYTENLGTGYLQTADFDGAIAQFQRALKIAPEDATAHYDLGRKEVKRSPARGARRTAEGC